MIFNLKKCTALFINLYLQTANFYVSKERQSRSNRLRLRIADASTGEEIELHVCENYGS